MFSVTKVSVSVFGVTKVSISVFSVTKVSPYSDIPDNDVSSQSNHSAQWNGKSLPTFTLSKYTTFGLFSK